MTFMTGFRIDLRGGAFRSVFGFSWGHWRRQPWRLTSIVLAVLFSTLADVLTPLFSGQLVDAVANGVATDVASWHSALVAFWALLALALVAILLRHVAFMGIVELTLEMMSDISADAFHACSASQPTGMPTASPVPRCAR